MNSRESALNAGELCTCGVYIYTRECVAWARNMYDVYNIKKQRGDSTLLLPHSLSEKKRLAVPMEMLISE